ncbi:MAG TPA: hypothetical protein VGN72_16740 [Tepidisphaeraceae bacterium]|nr:hypothetical protein [Tepidisphaeraceae bacterium]
MPLRLWNLANARNLHIDRPTHETDRTINRDGWPVERARWTYCAPTARAAGGPSVPRDAVPALPQVPVVVEQREQAPVPGEATVPVTAPLPVQEAAIARPTAAAVVGPGVVQELAQGLALPVRAGERERAQERALQAQVRASQVPAQVPVQEME